MGKNKSKLATFLALRELPLFIKWYQKLSVKSQARLREETGLSFDFDQPELQIIFKYLYECYYFNQIPCHKL